jgi:transcriptional regulator with XRE-family HTH domain
MTAKQVHPIDIAVGRSIRLHRMNAKFSQTELGDQIGVTFQQVQKYEKGANRVGASRLVRIAAALNVPVTAFFKDAAAHPKGVSETSAVELLAAPRALKLLKAFTGISDPALQSAVVRLVELISAGERD